MALEFPTSPSVNDTYLNWYWNGEAWKLAQSDSPNLVTDLFGSTATDQEPANYNLVVIDAATGKVKSIPSIDVIIPE